ncbi:MAG: FtsX-like permease family protein [Phycisphaeraceae bacterium]
MPTAAAHITPIEARKRLWRTVLLMGVIVVMAGPVLYYISYRIEASRIAAEVKEKDPDRDPNLPLPDPEVSPTPMRWVIGAGSVIMVIGALGLATVAGIILMLRRSLRQHALSTLITVVSVGLATGLLMSVFSIRKQTHDAFTSGATGFDAVLGARGSSLQLILSSVFHLETSPGNMPWSAYVAIKADPRVKLAIPFATGDNYKGFRIVGTDLAFFREYSFGKDRKLKMVDGTAAAAFFNEDGTLKTTLADHAGHRIPRSPMAQEAVLGSIAARQAGLRHGDKFNTYHGLTYIETEKHSTEFTVVGVLEPTNTPIDRVIWIPIEGYFHMAGHEPVDKTGRKIAIDWTDPASDDYRQVSAVMLRFIRPSMGQSLEMQINRQGTVYTLAWPIGKIMAELFDKIGWANLVLAFVAYLVAIVAGAGIMASIYNTMNERRREFAILRALGASRGTVFAAIVSESMAIAALGVALGFVIYGALVAYAAVEIRNRAGVVLDVTAYHDALLFAPLGMIGLGALAGLVPAYKAYSTDVATNLVPAS